MFLLSEDVVVALSGYLNAISLADPFVSPPPRYFCIVFQLPPCQLQSVVDICSRDEQESSITELTCCFPASWITTVRLQWLQSLSFATFVPNIRTSATYLTYLHMSVPRATYLIISNSRFAAGKKQQLVSNSMPMIVGIKTMI